MLWCKVALSSLFVKAVLASLDDQHEYGTQHDPARAAGQEVSGHNFVRFEGGRNDHANHFDHDEHYTAQRYKFGYKIIDKYGNKQTREEEADEHNNRKGYYSFIDHDGKHRKVQYVADGHGFRAIVVTNEPGTADSHPAEVKIIADPANHATSDHSGSGFLDPRATLFSGSSKSVVGLKAAAASPATVIAHRASIAQVAHGGASIAVRVPHEKNFAALPASFAPPYVTRIPHPIKQVLPNYFYHDPRPGSLGHDTVSPSISHR